MKTVKVTNRLEAPVEQVFAAFTDIEHSPQRVSGIKGVELLTPGALRLGTRWREIREVLGRLDSAEMEVTAYEKDHSYTITHYKGGAKIDTVFEFVPDGSGTIVSIEFGLENRGGLPPGLLAPVAWAIAGKVREALDNDLSDMKRSVETT